MKVWTSRYLPSNKSVQGVRNGFPRSTMCTTIRRLAAIQDVPTGYLY